MNLTGRQLFEMWVEKLELSAFPDPHGFWNVTGIYWDALADKLNGMMAVAPPASPPAESGLTMFDHWMGDKRRKQSAINLEQLDRARHSAICPYRHGEGECTC